MLRRWIIFTSLLLAAAAVPLAAAGLWSYPASSRSFDRGANGLWVGHRWYTGREVRANEDVSPTEIEPLVARLRSSGIRFLFVHVGPLRSDGSIEDTAGPLFASLRNAYPEGVVLAWLGARIENVRLGEADWRQAATSQIERLAAEGFDGVHFNLEPLRDGHAGYLELLAEVRARLGDDWIISQATPRSAPFGLAVGPLRRSFWSGGFYRATMDIADQTVIMAYETGLPIEIGYVAFVRDQTRRLVEWACAARRHEILIGLPSYHDQPTTAGIENIANAASGVRSALESLSEANREADCFRGVAIYANWVTDADEWQQLDEFWRRPAAN